MDVLPAKRLANAIATLICLAVLGSVLLASSLGSDAVFIVVIYGFVSVVSIYVTFGWLEQTLRLLIRIAFNTAGVPADLMAPEDGLVEDVE